MNFRDATRGRQAELDAFARKRDWERGRFKSWKIRGWTVSVGATGYPRRHFVAAKDDDVREFAELDELARFVLGRDAQTSRQTPRSR